MKPINACLAAKIEAMRLSRLAIRDQIRAQGLRPKDYDSAEVSRLAKLWFTDHRAELVDIALRTVLANVLCSNLSSAAQRSNAHSKRVSSERMLGAKCS